MSLRLRWWLALGALLLVGWARGASASEHAEVRRAADRSRQQHTHADSHAAPREFALFDASSSSTAVQSLSVWTAVSLKGAAVSATLDPAFKSSISAYTVRAPFGHHALRLALTLPSGTSWSAQTFLNGDTQAAASASYGSASSGAASSLALSELAYGEAKVQLVVSTVDTTDGAFGTFTLTVSIALPSVSQPVLWGVLGSTAPRLLGFSPSFSPETTNYAVTAIAMEKLMVQFTARADDMLTLSLVAASGASQSLTLLPGAAREGMFAVSDSSTYTLTIVSAVTSMAYAFAFATPTLFIRTLTLVAWFMGVSTALALSPTADPTVSSYTVGLSRAAQEVRIAYTLNSGESLRVLRRQNDAEAWMAATSTSCSIGLDGSADPVTVVLVTGTSNFTLRVLPRALALRGLTLSAQFQLLNTVASVELALSPPLAPFLFDYLVPVPAQLSPTMLSLGLTLAAASRVSISMNTSSALAWAGDATSSQATSVLVTLPLAQGRANLVTISPGTTYAWTLTLSVPAAPYKTVVVSAPKVRLVDPPASGRADELLQLRSEVSFMDTLTLAANLRYTWTCSDPRVVLWDPANLQGAANSSALLVRPGVLAEGSYTLTLTLTDSDPTHVTDKLATPTAQATTVVQVLPAVPFAVQTIYDPCASQSPCLNGGVCSSVEVPAPSASSASSASSSSDGVLATSSSSTGKYYRMSCSCPTAPVAFFGPTCSVAIVRCSDCQGPSPITGNKTIALYGMGFVSSLLGVTVAGKDVAFARPRVVTAAESTEVVAALATLRAAASDAFKNLAQLELLEFSTPSIAMNLSVSLETSSKQVSRSLLNQQSSSSDMVDSYKVLTLSALPAGATSVVQLSFYTLLFYSASACTAHGQWKADGMGGCLPCPIGAYCPGGSRLWPVAGYWSSSESSVPQKCGLAEACLGVDPEQVTASTVVDTRNCAAGYEDTLCGRCSAAYYALGGRCYYCGSSTDQRAEISGVVSAGAGLMLLLASAVATLPPVPLASCAKVFRFLQEIALIGVAASPDLPRFSKEVGTFFQYVNYVNFDVQILRPGCAGVPTFDYPVKVAVTVAFMALAALLFLAACAARLLYRLAKERRMQATGVQSAAEQWKARCQAQRAQRARRSTVIGAGARPSSLVLVKTASLPPLEPLTAQQLYDEFDPWVEFRQRLSHAFLILLSLFYLRMCILQFKAFQCTWAASFVPLGAPETPTTSLVLREDLQTQCLGRNHITMLVVVAATLVAYTLGFPLACLVILSRHFATDRTGGVLGWFWRRVRWLRGEAWQELRARTDWQVHSDYLPRGSIKPKRKTSFDADEAWNPQADPRNTVELSAEEVATGAREHRARLAAFGYLFVGYRFEFFAHCVLIYGVHLWFAAVQVFADADASSGGSASGLDQRLSLFLYGLGIAVESLLVSAQLPHVRFGDNVRRIFVNLITICHSAVMLAVNTGGIISEGTNADTDAATYFYVLLCLILVILLALYAQYRIMLASQQAVKAYRPSVTSLPDVNAAKAKFEEARHARRMSVLPPRASLASLLEAPRPSLFDPLEVDVAVRVALPAPQEENEQLREEAEEEEEPNLSHSPSRPQPNELDSPLPLPTKARSNSDAQRITPTIASPSARRHRTLSSAVDDELLQASRSSTGEERAQALHIPPRPPSVASLPSSSPIPRSPLLGDHPLTPSNLGLTLAASPLPSPLSLPPIKRPRAKKPLPTFGDAEAALLPSIIKAQLKEEEEEAEDEDESLRELALPPAAQQPQDLLAHASSESKQHTTVVHPRPDQQAPIVQQQQQQQQADQVAHQAVLSPFSFAPTSALATAPSLPPPPSPSHPPPSSSPPRPVSKKKEKLPALSSKRPVFSDSSAVLLPSILKECPWQQQTPPHPADLESRSQEAVPALSAPPRSPSPPPRTHASPALSAVPFVLNAAAPPLSS